MNGVAEDIKLKKCHEHSELMKRAAEKMHVEQMVIPYGQTESSPVITMSRVGDPVELRLASIGTALANTEVQIVDPKTGERLPLEQQGELCTRGYLVMKGYDGDPEGTAEAIDRHVGEPEAEDAGVVALLG